LLKSGGSAKPSMTAIHRIPKDNRSGASPIAKASQKLRRLFRPKAMPPQRPCESMSITARRRAADCTLTNFVTDFAQSLSRKAQLVNRAFTATSAGLWPGEPTVTSEIQIRVSLSSTCEAAERMADVLS